MSEISFETAGATLDFTTELVGQPTSYGIWGVSDDGFGGDFTLSNAPDSWAPYRQSFFGLTTSLGHDMRLMRLTSFAPVPEPTSPTIFLGASLVGLLGFRRRKIHA